MQYSNVYQFCYINELFIATERINYQRTREMFLHKYLIGKVLFLLNVWKVSGSINLYVLFFNINLHAGHVKKILHLFY